MGSALTVWLLITIGALLALLPLNFTFAQHTPLCISQFALANQACAVLPSEQALRGQNRTRSQDDDSEGGNNDDDDENDEDDDENEDGKDDESKRRRRRGNKKSGNKNKNKRKKKKGNKHAKKHKHGGGDGDDDNEPRANKDCCRWLEELDESCVCGVLLRLPPFLVKPTHEYSIKVGKSCKFTYNCYGI